MRSRLNTERIGLEEAGRKPPAKYLSYLLRLWEVSSGSGEGETWRASVECVQGGARVTFATLDELISYLRQQTQPGPTHVRDRTALGTSSAEASLQDRGGPDASTAAG